MSGRDWIKAIARGGTGVLVLPAVLSFRIRARLVGDNRALESSTQMFSLLPGVSGQYLRRAFLARTIAHCDPNVTVCFGTVFSSVKARIEADVYIGPHCHIGWANIERGALLGAGVHVPSGPEIHGIDDVTIPIRDQPGRPRSVRIGAGSWIGSASIVLADVGRDSVVGAGAVVTDTIPDAVIAVGVPARVIKSRSDGRPKLT